MVSKLCSISVPWELVRDVGFWVPPILIESEFWEVEPQEFVFLPRSSVVLMFTKV